MSHSLSFAHLLRLSSQLGLFEHALLTTPRQEHGYCLDDVARGLVVTARQPSPSAAVTSLTHTYLRFVIEAQDTEGRFHNRRSADGRWLDEASVDDHWGRALWGLGTLAALSPAGSVRDTALRGAAVGFHVRSPHNRAMSYAALGAFEVLQARPGNRDALALLRDARTLLGRPGSDAAWPWPEPRLTYGNAVIPEALLVIGAGLEDDSALHDGLILLDWLVEQETGAGHLSVTPVGGWRTGEPRPGFDQQPIEVAALAEACWRAHELTGDGRWLPALERCVAWFTGANDIGRVLYDPVTGGGRDGLHPDRVNENQGAESTLAALSTLQLGLRTTALAAP
jgi:hypothetical protein